MATKKSKATKKKSHVTKKTKPTTTPKKGGLKVTYVGIPSGPTLEDLQAAINARLQSVATDVFSGDNTLTLNFQKTAG